MGGLIEIATSSLKQNTANFFRIAVRGNFADTPAVLVVQKDDQEWAVSTEWDFNFDPKNKASMQEYLKLINEFDLCQKIQIQILYLPLF